MEGKTKFRIVSCSSEEPSYPVTNILVRSSGGWESARFCSYPQEITIQFYGEVNLKQIQFLSNSRKISSRIDILYYSTAGNNSAAEGRFTKYGFFELSPNQHTNYQGRQLKTITVDLRCTYLRFLLHKNHHNKQNFFSQVGLHEISCFGDTSEIPRPTSGKNNENLLAQADAGISNNNNNSFVQSFAQQNSNNLSSSGMQQPDDEFINAKLMLLFQMKEQAVRNENYDEAKRLKEVIQAVKNLGLQIKGLEEKKQEAVEQEEYDKAQKIKSQIEKIRQNADRVIAGMAVSGANPVNTRRKTNPNEQAEIQQHLEGSTGGVHMRTHENEFVESVENQEDEDGFDTSGKPLKISYDDRVIPTHLGKPKQQPNQQDLGREQLPAEPQPVPSKYQKEATQLSAILDQYTIRKYFSKHWLFRLDAMNTALKLLKEHKSTKDFPSAFKIYMSIVSNTIDDKLVQICQTSLAMLMELLIQYDKMHKEVNSVEVQSEADKILAETSRKINDNNVKTKGLADEVLRKMSSSGLYGVSVCSNVLLKVNPKIKLSPKQIKSRLDTLTYFISLYGMGSNNVPLSSIEFAGSYTDNQSLQVRNASIDLLVEASMHDAQDRVMANLERLPASVKQMIVKKITNAKNARQQNTNKNTTKGAAKDVKAKGK